MFRGLEGGGRYNFCVDASSQSAFFKFAIALYIRELGCPLRDMSNATKPQDNSEPSPGIMKPWFIPCLLPLTPLATSLLHCRISPSARLRWESSARVLTLVYMALPEDVTSQGLSVL